MSVFIGYVFFLVSFFLISTTLYLGLKKIKLI